MIQTPIPKPIRFTSLTLGSFFRPLIRNITPVKVRAITVDEALLKKGELFSKPVYVNEGKKNYIGCINFKVGEQKKKNSKAFHANKMFGWNNETKSDEAQIADILDRLIKALNTCKIISRTIS